MGKIVGGLTAYQQAMESGATAALSSIAVSVTNAVSDFRVAAAGATSSNPEAMKELLSYLEQLSEHYVTPPTHPSAASGRLLVTEIQQAATKVGCTF